MQSIFRSFSCVLKIFFLSAIFLTTSLTSNAQSNSVLIRVTSADYAQVTDIETIHTIDYGAFVWLELTQENLAVLQDRGVQYEPQRAPEEFQLPGLQINTSVKPAPDLSLSRTTTATTQSTAAEAEFYLVQLLGPAKDEWINDLAASGITSLRYLSPYVHLIRIAPGQADSLQARDYVRWVSRFTPASRISAELASLTGLIENVNVNILAENADSTIAAIEALGGTLVERDPDAVSMQFITVTFALPDSALTAVSELNAVFWLSFRPPFDEIEDEMSTQIISGNFGPITTGYQTWLTANGVNGNGITLAVIDTGFDTGVAGTSHQDLSARLVMVGTPTDTSGHGTHVGGIIAANASLGSVDGSGYLLGLGVAPQANLVVRFFNGTDATRQQDAVTRGAVASNNSYGVNTAGTGYSTRDATLDGLVRDADTTTTAIEPMSIIFSAGNSGATGPTKNAKNIIAVANSLNERTATGTVSIATNINTLRGSSSRGPAADGRIYPHLTAPGTNIVSTRSTQTGLTNCLTAATGANAPATDPTYVMCTGTSMAAPHVTGAAGLVVQWWNSFNGGNPSPAMVKALLVNGAVDMGTADIPNSNEGWGRINLANVINTGIPTQYVDQTTVFGNTGASWVGNFSPANSGQPVKVTVEWSDAPGAPAAAVALVNDLDIMVTDGTNTYLGNVFTSGTSTTGGVADTLNNLENVFIASQTAAFTVTVTAAAINGDGIPGNTDTTDQDFALVCSNCVLNSPPTCDANGPYVAECGLNTALDGTGSSDVDGDPLTFSWSGPFTGSPTTGATPSVVFAAPTGAKLVDLEVDDGMSSSVCSSAVTVQDTLAPSITVPGDKTAECAAPEGTAVNIGTAMAIDFCDASVSIVNDAPTLFPLGDTTVNWTATDVDGNFVVATQDVSIEDTLAPTLMCNSPATIVPPDAPISFTGSAEDQCAGPLVPVITDYDCFKYTEKGKRIDKTGSCEVSIDGDTVTILDSGGVNDNIEWTLTADDGNGNTTTETCSLVVVNPGGNN